MIPARFDYVAPTSVEEALNALAEHGDDAKIMAGGQSLLPLMWGELPRPAELDAALPRPLPALARPGGDQVALEIGQPAKNSQHARAWGARRVNPGVLQRAEASGRFHRD